MLRKLRLYAHTLRYLRPWQIAGRVTARLKRKFPGGRPPDPPAGLRGALNARTPLLSHDPWNTRPDILSGRFCFLRDAADLGQPVDWKAEHKPLLWRFNLHYFHYLHLLERGEQVDLCRSWIATNPVGQGVGWHPYPTSLRIVNWCKAGFTEADIQDSLYRQAGHLYRNLETYVCGNHLIENARALVFAGRFFEDFGEAKKWLGRGLDILRSETSEQILPDGVHFERSPMYHALMLEAYADVLNILPKSHPDEEWLRDVLARMSDALRAFTHPDGQLALFNDATQEIAAPASEIVGYVERLTGRQPQRIDTMPAAGYRTYRDDEVYLIVDGGEVAPSYLMAHAHADIFSYELSLAGMQFIVDSGVYQYAPGSMRDYARSTAAHNTVSVDGEDQVECWGSFRVARRDAPYGVESHTEGDVWRFEGAFGGYAKWIGDRLVHRRKLRVDPKARQIFVEDLVTGSGRHRVESRIHFHPDVSVAVKNSEFELERDGLRSTVRIIQGDARLERGWYCPEFGLRLENDVLVLGVLSDMPCRLEYAISF